MVAVHPGRLLKREHVAREVSANKLALHVPSGRITSILNGKRAKLAGDRVAAASLLWQQCAVLDESPDTLQSKQG